MDTLTLFEILTLAAGLIGVYVKLTQEMHKLKSRIISLEKTEGEVKLISAELRQKGKTMPLHKAIVRKTRKQITS